MRYLYTGTQELKFRSKHNLIIILVAVYVVLGLLSPYGVVACSLSNGNVHERAISHSCCHHSQYKSGLETRSAAMDASGCKCIESGPVGLAQNDAVTTSYHLTLDDHITNLRPVELEYIHVYNPVEELNTKPPWSKSNNIVMLKTVILLN